MPNLSFIFTFFFLVILINESNAGKYDKNKKQGSPVITKQPEKHSRVGTVVKYEHGEVSIIADDSGETSRILAEGQDGKGLENDEEISRGPIKQASSKRTSRTNNCCTNETWLKTVRVGGICLHGANAAAIYTTAGLAPSIGFKILRVVASSLVFSSANVCISCRKGDFGCKHSDFLAPVMACGCSVLPTAASLYVTGGTDHLADLGSYAGSCLCNACCFQVLPHITTPPGDCIPTCCKAGVFPDFRTVRDIRKAKYLPDEEYPKGCCKCMRLFYECCEYGCYASDQ
jgi:hypothetical protein